MHRGTNIPKPNSEFSLNRPSDSTRYSQFFGCSISFMGDTLDAFKHHTCAALAFNNTVASYKSLSAFVSTRYILSFVFTAKSTSYSRKIPYSSLYGILASMLKEEPKES